MMHESTQTCFSEHPVTRHDDGQGIRATGLTHRTRRRLQLRGQRPISSGFAAGNILQGTPNFKLVYGSTQS